MDAWFIITRGYIREENMLYNKNYIALRYSNMLGYISNSQFKKNSAGNESPKCFKIPIL
jgi:hypothetical protein